MNSKIILTEEDLLSGIVIDTRLDIEVVEIKNLELVQQKLLDIYGSKGQEQDNKITLSGDRSAFKKRYSYGDLLAIMRMLSSEGGCPWDMAQTHESIRINVIEEAYELARAIDLGDLDNIIEESGDILLQAVFHADIGRRAGTFDINEVIDSLCKKLVSRHTHIFGEDKATSAEEALKVWEKAKGKEKKSNNLIKIQELESSMPTLLYVQKGLSKMQKDGYMPKVDKCTTEHLMQAVMGLSGSGIDGEVELRKEFEKLVLDFYKNKDEE